MRDSKISLEYKNQIENNRESLNQNRESVNQNQQNFIVNNRESLTQIRESVIQNQQNFIVNNRESLNQNQENFVDGKNLISTQNNQIENNQESLNQKQNFVNENLSFGKMDFKRKLTEPVRQENLLNNSNLNFQRKFTTPIINDENIILEVTKTVTKTITGDGEIEDVSYQANGDFLPDEIRESLRIEAGEEDFNNTNQGI